MTNFVNRMKSGLRRMGDWISGHDVDVATGSPQAELLENRATARPMVDVLESEHELLVVADVPGAPPDATSIHVDGERLTIHARVTGVADAHPLLGGVSDADWYVDLALTDVVDADRIHAALRDGVLTVRLPKRERPAPRRIPVTT